MQNCLKIRSCCDHMLTGRTDRSETVHQIMNHYFDIYKGTRWSTCQNSIWGDFPIPKGSTKVSVTTFLSGLQKLPKIGRPRDIWFWAVKLTSRKPNVTSWITHLTHIKWQDGLLIVHQNSIWRDLTIYSSFNKCFCYNIPHQFADTSENWKAFWYHILTGRIKGQDGLVIVPVKIRFDETHEFAAGSANVSVTRFAERSENSEGCWHQILTGKLADRSVRSEARKSNNESLIKGAE